MKALILSGTNNTFTCECDDGVTRQCTIKGKVIKLDKLYYNPLAPGDYVNIEIDPINNDKGQILNLEQRKNAFSRYNIKGKSEQLLACNLDYLILVTTPSDPPFRPRFIDRELIQAEITNITPIIVCNKCDLETSLDTDFTNRIMTWEKLGYKVIKVSAKQKTGLKEFSNLIANKTCALVGQSGVGKSTLINSLDTNLELRTGEISKKYNRGQHTTTKVILMHITLSKEITGNDKDLQTSIIDTPGIRRFILNDLDAQDVGLYFKEIKPFLGQCKFGASCSHLHEAGCKVIENVNSGLIDLDRYESFKRITEELKTGRFED